MSCGCIKPEKTSLWLGVGNQLTPDAIRRGENIDCYANRSDDGEGSLDEHGEKTPDIIDNSSMTSDLQLNVNIKFELTPGSTRTASSWTLLIDGNPFLDTFTELSFNVSSGVLSGKVSATNANKNYEVEVIAKDSANAIIDSRKYNFYPKDSTNDDIIHFIFPVDSNGTGNLVINSPFGNRMHPIKKIKRLHKGIDIINPLGNNYTLKCLIIASSNGKVVFAGNQGEYGNKIEIEHYDSKNELVATTVYGHAKTLYVKTGDSVKMGQRIGEIGSTGASTGPHLHFEIRKGSSKTPVDPVPYIRGNVNYYNNAQIGTFIGDPSTLKYVSNSNNGMSSKESKSMTKCPTFLPESEAEVSEGSIPDVPGGNYADNKIQIKNILDSISWLTQSDKRLLMFICFIESGYNNTIKNPTSTAYGLFQFLDDTAFFYFKKAGITLPPKSNSNHYEIRSNIENSVRAQVELYKEQKKYYTDWIASGKTSINNTILKEDVKNRYQNYTKEEFIYGKIHHDGIGNTINGTIIYNNTPLVGVQYYRTCVNKYKQYL